MDGHIARAFFTIMADKRTEQSSHSTCFSSWQNWKYHCDFREILGSWLTSDNDCVHLTYMQWWPVVSQLQQTEVWDNAIQLLTMEMSHATMYWTSWAALSHSIPTFHSVSLGKCARTHCTYNKTCLQQRQAFMEAQNYAQCKFPACILIFKQKPTLFLTHHARLTKDEASSGYMHHHTFYMYIYTSLSNCKFCTSSLNMALQNCHYFPG